MFFDINKDTRKLMHVHDTFDKCKRIKNLKRFVALKIALVHIKNV